MQTQFNETLTAATSKSYETLKNLGDINSSALRKITDLQFDFISMNVESGIEQAKSLNSKKDAKDIFASSAEFVSDYNEKMLGFTNQTVEILTESSNEAKSLFEKVIASKAAPAKKPAKAKTTEAETEKPAAKKAAKKEA
jgi:phasin family protein